MFRGDIVKDDSGSYAAFTEHGSSASQMTVATVMGVIAILSDCDGQAADAISAYTQVKLEDAPKLLKIPKSQCPDVWIHHIFHDTNGRNLGQTLEILWYLSKDHHVNGDLENHLMDQ